MKQSLKLYAGFLVIVIMAMMPCVYGSIYDSQWKAEEYFDDPQLVALCKAIERADLAEMERLVKAGADVNARGKDSMTPLLWGYPMGEKVLEKLLELGADPNTQYDSFFGTRGEIERGDSLLFMAVKSTGANNTYNREKFQNYVDILLKHGADPNLIQARLKMPPLWNAIRFNNPETAEKLIKAGANIDFKDNIGAPLLDLAAGLNSYDVLQVLLDHGANYCVIDKSNGLTVAHRLARDYHLMSSTKVQGKKYRKIIDWLEKRGISFKRAKGQLEQWQKMDNSDPKEAVKKYIAQVSQPEVEKWLPPGAEVPEGGFGGKRDEIVKVDPIRRENELPATQLPKNSWNAFLQDPTTIFLLSAFGVFLIIALAVRAWKNRNNMDNNNE